LYGGVSSNRSNLLGRADLASARFQVPGSGQAAQIVGELSSSSATGQVSVLAKLCQMEGYTRETK